MKILHLLFLLVAGAGVDVPAGLGVPMITRELDRGIAMASVASTTDSVFFLQAEKVYAEVKTVLPNVRGLTGKQQDTLQAKVTDLRMALDLVSGRTEF